MQEPQLFTGTIADNIRYGRPGATDEQVEAAARQANAHEFVEALPKGLVLYCSRPNVVVCCAPRRESQSSPSITGGGGGGRAIICRPAAIPPLAAPTPFVAVAKLSGAS